MAEGLKDRHNVVVDYKIERCMPTKMIIRLLLRQKTIQIDQCFPGKDLATLVEPPGGFVRKW